jgi:hypothetical protein
VGQATDAQRQRGGGQPSGAAECLADADSRAHPEADAAPPHAAPVGDGVPAPDRFAAPDRDTAADRHADVRVADAHPGTHPDGERIGNRLTGLPVGQCRRSSTAHCLGSVILTCQRAGPRSVWAVPPRIEASSASSPVSGAQSRTSPG